MDLMTLLIVLVYLLMTCYLGYQGYRQTKTAADYMVAGRNAHPVIMALSYGATFISTSAIVGFGGVAANFGMGLLWLTVLNIFVGIFIAFVWIGDPTRRMGHHLDAHTFPELLGKRYDSRFLQIFSALIIFVFMPLYAMAVIVGGAEFIGQAFQINYDLALYIFAFIVAGYVIAGGIKGVMLTDALQGTIMLVGMIILIIATYVMLGGVTTAHQALTDLQSSVPKSLAAIGHQGWTKMPHMGWAEATATVPGVPSGYNLWWIMVTTIIMGVGIGVLAQPQLIVRFMTVKSRQSLNRAVVAGGVFILFMTGVAFVTGALSNVFFAQKEVIKCHIVDDQVLMDPGVDGKAKLTLLAPNATPDVKMRAKRFVSYRLSHEEADAGVHYVLWTPAIEIVRGGEGALDQIKPHLIAIQRTIGFGTTMQGNSDTIIPNFVNSAMPRWFGIIFLLTLLSAAMSTLSSQFHTMGTAIGRDVFEQITHKHTGRSVFITRLGIVFGILVAITAGKLVRGNIIALATAIFFGLCAASFLPSFVFGLFWRRMTKAGAIASLTAGLFASLFWLIFMNAKTATGLGLCRLLAGRDTLLPKGWSPTWSVVDPLIIALPLSLVVAVIVSLMTRPMKEEYVNYCFGGPKPDKK